MTEEYTVPAWASEERFGNNPAYLITPYMISRELQRIVKELGGDQVDQVVESARGYLSFPDNHLSASLDWFSDTYMVPAVRSALKEQCST